VEATIELVVNRTKLVGNTFMLSKVDNDLLRKRICKTAVVTKPMTKKCVKGYFKMTNPKCNNDDNDLVHKTVKPPNNAAITRSM
jgi:hypothetical protein